MNKFEHLEAGFIEGDVGQNIFGLTSGLTANAVMRTKNAVMRTKKAAMRSTDGSALCSDTPRKVVDEAVLTGYNVETRPIDLARTRWNDNVSDLA